MFTTMILLLAVGQSSENATWSGYFVATSGQVVIERQGADFRAARRAGLTTNDIVKTGADGGALFQLDQEVFIYLGPSTTVQINGPARNRVLQLVKGEARISVPGPDRVDVMTNQANIHTNRGIVRISAKASGTRIWTENGTAIVRDVRGLQSNETARRAVQLTGFVSMQDGEITLNAGQEMTVPAKGPIDGPRAATKLDWLIDPRRWRDLSAEQAANSQTRGQQNPQSSDEQQNPRQGQREEENENTQNAAAIALGLGGLASNSSASASAGLFADAAQFTLQGQNISEPSRPPFPGNIHLVTGESRYGFSNVQLTDNEKQKIFSGGSDPAYFSIGIGAKPTSQVVTSFNTATNVDPRAVSIPHFNAYTLRLDQYGPVDAPLDPAAGEANNVGYAGLLGDSPTAPTVNGATPSSDERAKFNALATFALGEFRLRPDGGGDGNSFELAIRRSDQDRKIVKDPNGDDANDKVTPNPDVGQFDNVADPRFLPAAPTVKVPKTGTYDSSSTRFAQLNNLRRAAVTTVMADQLFDYSRRTGQTRFVIDGKIIDITGYKKH